MQFLTFEYSAYQNICDVFVTSFLYLSKLRPIKYDLAEDKRKYYQQELREILSFVVTYHNVINYVIFVFFSRSW